MKIKVTAVMKNYTGEPMQISDDGKKERDMLVRDAILLSVNTMQQNEQLNGNQKAQAYAISQKTYKNSNPDYSVKELSFIKERAEKILNVVMLGRLNDIIDPSAAVDEAPTTPAAE